MPNIQTDDITINTLIGAGSTVSGDLKVSGFIRIDGDLTGTLETPGRVIIGEKARIKADIKAASVIVGGVVEGDIVAPDSIIIYSSGVVIGDLVTKRLRIDDDVIIQGKCISIQNETAFADARSKWQDRKAIRINIYGKYNT